MLALVVGQAQSSPSKRKPPLGHADWKKNQMTQAMREAAAARTKKKGVRLHKPGVKVNAAAANAAVPGGTPDDLRADPNLTNSPLPPTVTISDPTGTGAVAEATVVGGVATGVTVLAPGVGYTSPTVSIVGWDGTGATAGATLDLSGGIGAVTVTNGGSGYGGIRKFVDPLTVPPVATPDTTTYPGSDYYEIELGKYHPAAALRPAADHASRLPADEHGRDAVQLPGPDHRGSAGQARGAAGFTIRPAS